ncbi:MAG: DUF1574 domain-containing protein [Cyanobacteria bacterium J06648_16]
MLGKSKSAASLLPSDLLPWLAEAIHQPTERLQVKLRGNILHVLCESDAPLPREHTLLRLVKALLEPSIKDWFAQDFSQIYQLYFYSRQPQQKQPDWSAPIYLNRLERHLDRLIAAGKDAATVQHAAAELLASKTQAIGKLDETTSAIVRSNVSLAKKGDADAIARYLSETLSALDIGVEVSVKAVPGKAKRAKTVMALRPVSVDPAADLINRLWIFCQASYSPDPTMIAGPTAQRLRALELTQFQDAVLSVKVEGETEPDWQLRVDLTPAQEILREWARWGDRRCITRLVNQALAPLELRVSSETKGSTLHFVCTELVPGPYPQETGAAAVLQAVTPLLDQLGPQGIHRAMLYGPSPDGVNPVWLECIDLPASEHRALAASTRTLARNGDLHAIAYQLTRLVNPDLDQQLVTGGVRVQLLVKDQRLHVMTDAPWCPKRHEIAPAVIKYFRKDKLEGVEGIRIYGRRSGQKRPDWSHGYDFNARPRLVPEATPEFAASDTYLSDLIEPTPATAEAETAEAGLTLSQQLLDIGRQILLQTQLFTQLTEAEPQLIRSGPRVSRRLALVWGAAGVLLALQADWILGQMVNGERTGQPARTEQAVEAEPETEPSFAEQLDQLNWGQAADTQPEPISGETRLEDRLGDALDSDPFGRNPLEDRGFATSAVDDADLISSDDQTFVSLASVLAASPYPSFTSRQLDEKLALYHQRVQSDGPPDVLIIGSSRALRGIDPTALRQALAAMGQEDVSIFNFGINGSTAQVADLIVRQLLQPYPKPKLVLWADGARAFNSGRVDITFNAIAVSEGYRRLNESTLFPPELTATAAPAQLTPEWTNLNDQITGYYSQLDRHVSQALALASRSYDSRERAKNLVREVYDIAVGPVSREERPTPTPGGVSEGDLIDFDGFLPLAVRFNPATYYQNHARVAGDYDSDYDDFQLEGDQLTAFDQLLSYTQSQDIPLIFVNTPLTDEYLDTARQQAEIVFQRYLIQTAAQEEGFFFRDLGQLWPNRYDYFSDPSHLNRYGAYQVSHRLAQDPLIPWIQMQ